MTWGLALLASPTLLCEKANAAGSSESVLTKQKSDSDFAFTVLIQAVDAKTNQPLKQIRVVPTPHRARARTVTWQSQYVQSFEKLPATFHMKRGWSETKLRIECPGYLPLVTKPLKKARNIKLKVSLQPSKGIAGRVITPEGKPAAGAMLAVCTWTNEVTVRSKSLKYGHHAERLRGMKRSGKDGSFQLAAEVDEWVLVVAHESGFAEPTAAEFAKQRTVKLKPWGRLEGEFKINGKAMPNQPLNISAGRGDAQVVLHYSVPSTVSDKNGKFTVDGLPPVKVFISPLYRHGGRQYGLFWFGGLTEIKAGTTTRTVVPKIGPAVVGSLVFDDTSEYTLDNTEVEISISLRPPAIRGFGRGTGDPLGAHAAFMQTEAAGAFRREKIRIDKEGGFRIEGLPESSYVLRVNAYRKTKPGKERGKPVATLVRRVQTSSRFGNKQPVDLGDLVIKEK